MTEATARQILLAARPHGKPQLTDFRLEETGIPTPSAGQVLLRVQYLSGGESVATVIVSQHAG
jgi:NADPH-dependent curcumin reductase CurA